MAQIIGLSQHGSGQVQAIAADQLSHPDTRVKLQLMQFVPVFTGTESDDSDWEWNGCFELSGSGNTSFFEVEGRYVQALNPAIALRSRLGQNRVSMTYRLLSQNLMVIAEILYRTCQSDLDQIPNVTWTSTFPYRTSNGI